MGSVMDPPADSRIGSVLMNQYRLDSRLSQGGMGTVYTGTQLSVNRPVAIKLIAGSVGQNPERAQRFRREAAAMARLRHPNTVRLFEFGVSEQNELFMVMELLEGCDLADRITASGPLPVPEALTIVRQVLESLAEAHALGIVHRDLKPANIFLAKLHGGGNVVKVMDFGIAGIEQTPDLTKLTMTGMVIGTPAYMSPEQASGNPVDARSDLYSLGVTLFEMLTARTPFEVTSPASLLIAHIATPPAKLSQVRPDADFPPELQELLDRLLEKSPERRPASAQDAIDLVDGLLRSQSGLSESARRRTSTLEIVAQSIRMHWREPGGKKRAALLGLLPALALAAWAVWPSGAEPASAGAEPHVVQPAAAAPLHTVRIVSAPDGAAVYLQNVELGRTPYEFQYRKDTELTLRAPGHEPYALFVATSSEPNLVVELVPVAPAASTPLAAARSGTRRATAGGGTSTASAAPNGSLPVVETPPPTAAASTGAPERAANANANANVAGPNATANVSAARATGPTADAADSPAKATGPNATANATPASSVSAAASAVVRASSSAAPSASTAAPSAVAPAAPTASAAAPSASVKSATSAALASTPSASYGSNPPSAALPSGVRPSSASAVRPEARTAALATLPSRERREVMASSGAPYANVASARRAYQAGKLDTQFYGDVIWALKVQRKARITAEKVNLRRNLISREEYERRVKRIDQDYEGN